MPQRSSRRSDGLVRSSVKCVDSPFFAADEMSGRAGDSSIHLADVSHAARERQLAGHLLRLKELRLERIFLLEKIQQCKLAFSRSKIATEKHREAASRTVALQEEIRTILNEHGTTHHEGKRHDDNASSLSSILPIAVGAVCSPTNNSSCNSQVVANVFHKLLKIYAPDNALCTSSLAEDLKTFLISHYVTQYTSRYFPVVASLALTRQLRSAEQRSEEETLRSRQEAERLRGEQKRAREARRVQLSVARERLQKAEKNVFVMRKNIFLLHEMLTRRMRLPTGEQLNSVMCAEIIHRIREEVARGEMEFVYRLSADGGRALSSIAALNC